MDNKRVDALESGRAATARRGMIGGLTAATAAAALGRFGVANAAKRKKKKSLCKRCPKYCEARDIVLCRPTANPEAELCACARATDGGSTCVDIRAGDDCSATDRCQTDADCPADNACIAVHAVAGASVDCCPVGMTGSLCKPICTPEP
jgi:hypothetical protein